MKTIAITLICILCLSALSTAQEQSLNDFKREYNHRDGIRTFTIPGFLVRLAGGIALNDESRVDREALRPLLKNMGSVSIFLSEGETRIHPRDIEKLKDDLLDESYEPLVKVKDGRDEIEVFSWEKKDVIRRLVFFIHDEDGETIMVNIRGYFTPEEISKVVDRYHREEFGRKL